MNLRDWQKKASARLDIDATNELFKAHLVDEGDSIFQTMYKKGFSSRDHEIDLLLQIIEKQSEALRFYSRADVWGTDMPGTRTAIDPCDQEELELRSSEKFFKDVRGGKLARTTQAEVQGLVEKLVKE